MDDEKFDLLVKLQALAAGAPVTQCSVPESEQERGVLWNGKDRVQKYYVIVRHFATDHFGMHVGLAAPVTKTNNIERHIYRLPSTTLEAERLGIYIYNPGCVTNGPLIFNVSRYGNASATSKAIVLPDTCPCVHTIASSDMHEAATLLLTQKNNFCVCLLFTFE
jgi:hypothetical protein